MHWNPALSRSFHLSCITLKKLQKIRNLTAFVCVQTVQQNALFRNTVHTHAFSQNLVRWPISNPPFISGRFKQLHSTILFFNVLIASFKNQTTGISYEFDFKIKWKNNGPYTDKTFTKQTYVHYGLFYATNAAE